MSENNETEQQTPHTCPTHGVVMVERDMKGATYEQKFCGVWFDCPRPGCRNTALEQSDELKAQLDAQRRSLHPHMVYCGPLEAMEALAEQGVKGLNPDTHRWSVVSKAARYLVVKDKELPDGWTAFLYCNENLRAIANERGLILS